MRLTVVVARAQFAEFPTQRHILSMKRANDTKHALIARRAQGIGSGLHPESDFETTSKLFICAGNKNSDVVFILYMEIIDVFSSLFKPCLRPASIETQNVSSFEEEFIRERNGLDDISVTNNFLNLNGLCL
jgi:hypothetical protein